MRRNGMGRAGEEESFLLLPQTPGEDAAGMRQTKHEEWTPTSGRMASWSDQAGVCHREAAKRRVRLDALLESLLFGAKWSFRKLGGRGDDPPRLQPLF